MTELGPLNGRISIHFGGTTAGSGAICRVLERCTDEQLVYVLELIAREERRRRDAGNPWSQRALLAARPVSAGGMQLSLLSRRRK